MIGAPFTYLVIRKGILALQEGRFKKAGINLRFLGQEVAPPPMPRTLAGRSRILSARDAASRHHPRNLETIQMIVIAGVREANKAQRRQGR